MALRCWLLEAKPILWVCCCTFAWKKKKIGAVVALVFSADGLLHRRQLTRLESNYVAWPSLDLHFY